MRLFQGQNLFSFLTKQTAEVKIEPAALVDAASQVYVKDLALYTAASLIADLMGRCERQVYRDGHQIRDANWYRWNMEANPNQSGDELFRRWILEYYYQGQALVVPVMEQLYVADGYSTIESQLYGDTYVNVNLGTLQLERRFAAWEVYHLSEGPRSVRRMVDGMWLRYAELLAAAGDSVTGGSGEKYSLQLGRPPSGTPEQQEEYNSRLRDNMASFVSSRRAVYPLYRDQTLTKLSSGSGSVSASAVVELRKEVYDMVAMAIHMPQSLMEGTTNNTEQVLQQTLTFALDPLAHRVGRELTRKTFTRRQITEQRYGMRVDTSKLLHVDLMTMADQADKLIASGIACIDEVRRRGGLPEIDEDWARRHYITKNYDGVEDTLHPLKGS